ncbi:sugar phosphate nucleotidyltransferase [Neobacillus sp. SuZ13]|uniref:sugar phosphate nucleotidyltransferase n=1 Tax=Neobacillus sp. SuZ13 TaxID=3047875 RepID=UPI0024C04C03|nr:sugar phosphate nucleotidyltransferase [Neobacillus sp. SuZ13]WHY69735.1 sugar phosphate nucleotidyltransferase [Neobacillus sp. SuZ13]
MKIVLLSGGSGKRLWPLSNDTRAKQFLKLLKNVNEEESMVQRIWRQLSSKNLEKASYITASKTQVDIIRNQLGEHVPLIVEPERKDTFPAIILAITYLHSIQKVSSSEIICIVPVDSYVKDDYFETIESLETILSHSNANLALIGAKPTYPSGKYGYIIPESKVVSTSGYSYQTVKYFKEKPSEKEAEHLISQENGLWNCGVFAFKVEFILNYLRKNGLPINYEELLNLYSTFPKISFDYQILEKTNNIVVVEYNGPWKDLGTWNTFTEEIGQPILGNAIISDECRNTHIINDLDIPVVTLGMVDSVIACSYDGILVAQKNESSKLKKYVETINRRPMFEERRWGWYKVLDYSKYNQYDVLTKKLVINKGENISYQYHQFRDEVWTIVSGQGIFVLDDKIIPVKTNDVLKIPQGSKHSIKAITELEIIEVQMGSVLEEEDIVRLYMGWDDMVQAIKKEGQ